MIPVSVQHIRPHHRIFNQIKPYIISKVVKRVGPGNCVNTPLWFSVYLRSVKRACRQKPPSGLCEHPLGMTDVAWSCSPGTVSRQFCQRGRLADFHSSPLEEERRKPRLKAIVCIWSELWDGIEPTHFFLGVFYIQSGGCIIYHPSWDTFESERGVLLIMTPEQHA